MICQISQPSRFPARNRSTPMTTYDLLAAERRELLALLRTLSADDWSTPSLCAGWTVRDVVAHLLWDTVTIRQYLWVAAKYWSPDRINQYYVDQSRGLSTDELTSRFESVLDGGWLSRIMTGGMLADLVVHQQDIRRPLGRPRVIEQPRLLHTLNHPNRWVYPRRFMRGLRFVATDVEWSYGAGPEVRGNGEALALAMAGRGVVLNELEGDGLGVLAGRLGRDRGTPR
jgi:uncharacterized protein (TIGR03083 family)